MSFSILDTSKKSLKDINYIQDPLKIKDEKYDKYTELLA